MVDEAQGSDGPSIGTQTSRAGAALEQERPIGMGAFTRRTWIVVSVTASVVAAFLLVVQVAQVLLMIFGGILLAVFLRGLARALMQLVPVPDGIALLLVGLLLIALLGVVGWPPRCSASMPPWCTSPSSKSSPIWSRPSWRAGW